MRVLRVYHSAVVTAWRQRDRELRRQGCEVRLISPVQWNEGGRVVALVPEGDDFVVASRTIGRHPYMFVFNPIPIVRELRTTSFDLVDVHEEPASLAALEMRVLLRLFQRGVPVVFYGAQNIRKRFPWPFSWIERQSLQRASGAHCCNAEAGEIFRSKGLDGVVSTIGLGVDVDRFNPDTRLPAEGVLRVGYFGRLEAHKGVDVLIRAVDTLPNAELLIHGDGSMREELMSLASAGRARTRITFVGYVHHDELPDRYRAVDVVAVPSLRTSNWVEQFGRVAVEAMASGVPVIASDDGALREVVGGAGVLVTAGDVEAWRRALLDLSCDPALRASLREAGLGRAAKYRWSEVASEQLALYRMVMDAPLVRAEVS